MPDLEDKTIRGIARHDGQTKKLPLQCQQLVQFYGRANLLQKNGLVFGERKGLQKSSPLLPTTV
jgi:hypothetical protein